LKTASEIESPPKQKAQFNISEETHVLSDDDEDIKKKKMNRASRKRFGHNIKFEKYRTSNLIKIICITLAIIIIPLEIFVQNVL
jgi:hypothetical protein